MALMFAGIFTDAERAPGIRGKLQTIQDRREIAAIPVGFEAHFEM